MIKIRHEVNFLWEVKQVCIKNFTSLKPDAIPRLKSPACPTISPIG